MSEFGILSVLPPVLAIALAIVTRKAVLSLFLGIWSGGVIYSGSLGLVQTFDWIIAAMSDELHATIIVFTLLLGSAVAMVWQLGGSYAIRDWALERIDTRRKVGAVTLLLGIVLFFDDYANTAITGSAMKDVSDRLRVSREKLSYIVDSTAAPVATLGISSWVAFQLGLISDAYASIGLAEHPSAFEIFVRSIPFNMYSILAIAMVGIVVFSGRDYGEMLTAEHRAWRNGYVTREDARPMQDIEGSLGRPSATNPRLLSFFLPIGVLIVVVIAGALWTGYEPGASLFDIVTNADYAAALVYGSFAMVASGFVLGKALRIFGFGEATDTVIEGFGIMLTALSILVLAWSIGEVVSALGTGEYVAGFIGDDFGADFLPAVVLVVAAFMAFSTGTSWGTMGILTPIAIPIVWELGASHTLVAATVGAIFSGSILGDHTSPISDTSVMSATFTGADLIDHVRTQLYYGLTVGIVSVFLLVVWGATGITPLLLLPAGVIILAGLVYGLSELQANHHGIDPVATNAPREDQDATDASADRRRSDGE